MSASRVERRMSTWPSQSRADRRWLWNPGRFLGVALLILIFSGCATASRLDRAIHPKDYTSKPWLR